MTRDEAVQKAEELFDLASEAVIDGNISRPRAVVELAVALGNGYLALARLADD